MSRVPSANIKAKDVIGYAQDLVSEDNTRNLIQSLGIQYYNSAVQEIYNIVLLIDPYEYDNYADISSALGNLSILSGDKFYTGDLNHVNFNNFDEIVSVRCDNGELKPECLRVPPTEFDTYFNYGSAGFPFEDTIIYCHRENKIDFCFGENIDVESPVFHVKIRKYPTLLSKTNYNSAMMAVADKYHPLLTNRIASYAELKKGIVNNTLSIVKLLYDQMISKLDYNIQTSIKKRLNLGE